MQLSFKRVTLESLGYIAACPSCGQFSVDASFSTLAANYPDEFARRVQFLRKAMQRRPVNEILTGKRLLELAAEQEAWEKKLGTMTGST
jgi:hypothetical protein